MMRNFDTGATRDSDDGKIHFKGFLSPHALRRFGEYMEVHRVQADGSLRAPDNWKRGIPLDAYEDSLIRHVQEAHALFDEGKRTEAVDVMCAVFFNVQGWLHEMTKPVLQTAAQAGRMPSKKLLEVDVKDYAEEARRNYERTKVLEKAPEAYDNWDPGSVMEGEESKVV